MFKIQVPAVYKALQEIEKWDDINTSTKASKLRSQIENFDFIAKLVFLEDIMQELEPLAKFLQNIKIDIYSALIECEKYSKKIISKISSPKSMEMFSILCDDILKIHNEIIPPGPFHLNKKIEFDKRKELFVFYAQIVSNFAENLESRLKKREYSSAKIARMHPDMIESFTLDDLVEICETFHTAISENGYDSTLIQLKKEFFKYKTSYCLVMKNCNFVEILPKISELLLIRKLFTILITITVTTSSAERSFSKLKLIKTILRNRISDDNVNNEALISLNRQAVPTASEVLDKFMISENIRIDV